MLAALLSGWLGGLVGMGLVAMYTLSLSQLSLVLGTPKATSTVAFSLSNRIFSHLNIDATGYAVSSLLLRQTCDVTVNQFYRLIHFITKPIHLKSGFFTLLSADESKS